MNKNIQVIAKSKQFDIQSSESLKKFIQMLLSEIREQQFNIIFDFHFLRGF